MSVFPRVPSSGRQLAVQLYLPPSLLSTHTHDTPVFAETELLLPSRLCTLALVFPLPGTPSSQR